MKKTFIIILIIIIISLFSLPSYVELNNLIIVEGIGVKCNKDSYTIYLKEIIPIFFKFLQNHYIHLILNIQGKL